MTGPTLDVMAVDLAVFARHPDYVATIMLVRGLRPGPSDDMSEELLSDAEASAVAYLAGREPHELPEVAIWREAFAHFGVKPRQARSSVEALMRRIQAGLPRIDRLTDVYNAISISHRVPIGGEDLAAYRGPARLVVATGTEPFDTIADGQPVVETPDSGEIVWRDDAGVTCRRWNWRQCTRTRISTQTNSAIFIVDALGPDAHARGTAAADALGDVLRRCSPTSTIEQRVISA